MVSKSGVQNKNKIDVRNAVIPLAGTLGKVLKFRKRWCGQNERMS